MCACACVSVCLTKENAELILGYVKLKKKILSLGFLLEEGKIIH